METTDTHMTDNEKAENKEAAIIATSDVVQEKDLKALEANRILHEINAATENLTVGARKGNTSSYKSIHPLYGTSLLLLQEDISPTSGPAEERHDSVNQGIFCAAAHSLDPPFRRASSPDHNNRQWSLHHHNSAAVLKKDRDQMACKLLDNWGHISACDDGECHRCLTTHSSRWHVHLGLATCHSCFVGLHRDACPFCGDIVRIVKHQKTSSMKSCVGCNRSFHSTCEVHFRGKQHPSSMCIVCEMQAILLQDRVPPQLALKRLPTILNFHIFNYKSCFGSTNQLDDRNCSSFTMQETASTKGEGAKLDKRESKSADEMRLFRQSLSLDSPYTSLSELSRATTFSPPNSAHIVPTLAPSQHSILQSGPFWGGQQWPVNRKSAPFHSKSAPTHEKAGFSRIDNPKSIQETSGKISVEKWTVSRPKSERPMFNMDKPQSAGTSFGLWQVPPMSSQSDRYVRFERAQNKESSAKAIAVGHTVTLSSFSNLNSAGTDPKKDSSPKMFSWEKRSRTASDKMKMTLEDPAPHRLPHPVAKFLTPGANSAYMQQSPRLRTHFVGMSPRLDYRQSKPKIDCWREIDRRRVETAKSAPASVSDQLEQKYRSTLNHINACVNDVRRPQTSHFPWTHAVNFEHRAHEHVLRVKRPTAKSEIIPGNSAGMSHLEFLALEHETDQRFPVRSRFRDKFLAQRGSTSGPVRKNTVEESEYIPRHNPYEKILQIIDVDFQDFGSDVLKKCQRGQTPQQFFEAVYNKKYRHQHENEPIDDDVSINSVGAQFEIFSDALHEICSSLANKLYMLDKTHGVKLNVTQAMLMVMNHFGIYPTLLGSRHIMQIVLKSITDCVHGFPETEERRCQKLLETVIIEVSLTVFREDPENLGVRRVIDIDAPDSHLVRMMLIYMQLDQQPRLEFFRTKFLTPEQIEDEIQNRVERRKNREKIAESFAGASDPILRTICRFQSKLQDVFRFFSSKSDDDALQITATSPSNIMQRVVHFSRNILSQEERAKHNETKVQQLQQQRLEVLKKLLKDTQNPQNPTDNFNERRAALQRVRALVAYGKINRTEAAFLAECLATPDSLHDPECIALRNQPDHMLIQIQQKNRKEKAFEFLISQPDIATPPTPNPLRHQESKGTSIAKYLVFDDFVPLCQGDLTIAQILWDCVRKKNPDRMDSYEFVSSLWTDNLCDTIDEKAQMLSKLDMRRKSLEQDKCTKQPASPIALNEPRRLGKKERTRNDGEKLQNDPDASFFKLGAEKPNIDSVIMDSLSELMEEVSKNIFSKNLFGWGPQSPRDPLQNDKKEQVESAFQHRFRYQVSESVDLSSPTISPSANGTSFPQDDEVPERCVSPDSFLGTEAIFKFAEVFGWIGTAKQVKEGLALLQDFELFQYCLRYRIPGFKLQLNWNSFLDLLIEIACNCVKHGQVNDEVNLDGTTSAYLEGLFYFMSLPNDSTTAQDWLKDRVHDVVRFRLYNLVHQPPPATLWLLPSANKPWRDGLHLKNDVRDIKVQDFRRLLDGESRIALPDSWGNSASTDTQTWFCIMFCDSIKDDKRSQIFQAVAWKHPWNFFQIDFTNSSTPRGFAEEYSVTNIPCIRVYCGNGFYRQYEGYWDTSTIDYWLCQQEIPDKVSDVERIVDDNGSVMHYFEVNDGVGAYLDACMLLSDMSALSSIPPVYPIKGFHSIFAGKILELKKSELSVPDAVSLAICLKCNQKLTSISLGIGQIKSEGLIAIMLAIALNKCVQILDLSSTRIGMSSPITKANLNALHGEPSTQVEQEKDNIVFRNPVDALSILIRCNRSIQNLCLRSCGLDNIAVQALSTGLRENLFLPLTICDLSDNHLGDAAVVALVKVCAVRNEEHARCVPLHHLNLTCNRITKIGRVCIANYLRFSAEDNAKPINIILSTQQPDPISAEEPLAKGKPKGKPMLSTQQTDPVPNSELNPDVLSRLNTLLSDSLLSLEEKFHLLKLHASGHRIGWNQAWELIKPFLQSKLCFQVVQWAFYLLCSVQDKDKFSDLFDDFMKERRGGGGKGGTKLLFEFDVYESTG